MLASILAFFQGLFQAIGIVSKYAPPKTEEQKQEESQQQIDDRLQKEEDGARPTWGS